MSGRGKGRGRSSRRVPQSLQLALFTSPATTSSEGIYRRFDAQDATERAVVAIDFGTTNSGAAYCLFADDLQQVKTLDFPGVSGIKVPTTVVIDKAPPHKAVGFGHEAIDNFDEEQHAIFHRFKMQLYEDAFRRYLKADVGDLQLETHVVIARCLELLKDKMLEYIKDTEDLTIGADEVRWVLTLPAIWSESSKALMRKAAHKAGLINDEMSERLILALEPECAALDCAATFGDHVLDEGSRCLVVDCGGGTVDTFAFQVVQSPPQLELRATLEPSGGDWGSTRIDRKFLDFLRELLGNPPCLRGDDATGAGLYDFMTSVWEDRKVRFGRDTISNPSGKITINLNPVLQEMDPAPNLKAAVAEYVRKHPDFDIKTFGSSQLKISPAFMKTFYEDVLRDIGEHVGKLIAENGGVDKVIVAGGFGGSSLVQDVIREEAERAGAGLLIPPKPWTSIVVGAVRFGLNPNVVSSRKSRFTYGTRICQTDVDRFWRQHPEVPRDDAHLAFDEKLGKTKFNHVFSVFAKRGDELAVDDAVTHTYYPVYEDQFSVSFNLLKSTSRDVVFSDEPSVTRLGSTTVNVQEEGSADDKPIHVTMTFGQTEIMVFVKSVTTGEEKRVPLKFNQ